MEEEIFASDLNLIFRRHKLTHDIN